MRGMMTALALGLGMLAVPALAQEGGAAAKSFQLSKVMFDSTSKQVQGKIKGGTLCVFPSKVDMPEQKRTEDYERFDNLFSDRLKARGYTVFNTSQDMFATEADTRKADYLVGATIRPDTMNICSSVNGYKGNLLVDVEWQIYDRAAQKVVETITLPGRGEIPKFDQNGYTELWNRAFLASLDALIDQGVANRYGGTPRVAEAASAAAAAAGPAAPAPE